MAELTFLPDYAFFTLRDPEADAGVDSATAIEISRRHIAASTGHEIYVCCAQDRIAVHVCVNADGPAADGHAWTHAASLTLPFPSGQVRLGDVTGTAISISLDTGPGTYRVDVHHRGRDAAAAMARQLSEIRRQAGLTTYLQSLDQHAGIEKYHLQLQPIP